MTTDPQVLAHIERALHDLPLNTIDECVLRTTFELCYTAGRCDRTTEELASLRARVAA